MAVMKYIIDKSDLPALIKGEDLALPPKGDIRGFCVEIAGELTNGDVLKAVFNPYKICDYKWGVSIYLTENDWNRADRWASFTKDWWNAPYKRGDEDADSN